jgi:hypothetical protein
VAQFVSEKQDMTQIENVYRYCGLFARSVKLKLDKRKKHRRDKRVLYPCYAVLSYVGEGMSEWVSEHDSVSD